jgi:opacity protein-like surface antigen
MKTFLLTLLLAALCLAASAEAQVVKALGYNTTNGQIVAATNVVWTNAFSFSTNTVAAEVRANLGLGAVWLTNTNVTNFRTAIGLGEANSPTFDGINVGADVDITLYGMIGYGAEIDLEERDLTAGSGYDWNLGNSGMNSVGAISFANTTNAATTRTNLGIPWAGLTNVNANAFLTALLVNEDINSTNLQTITAARHLYDETGQQPSLRGDDGEFITSASFVTTNTPANTTNAVRWLIIAEGTNSYRVPLFQ